MAAEAPSTSADYGDRGYWDRRYESGGKPRYDWYLPYSDMRAELLGEVAGVAGEGVLDGGRKEARAAVRVLVVGCGNSALSEELHADGFTSLLSVDYSPVVVERMQRERPALRFEVQDVTALSCADGEFDVVVDKGTLDAILCGTGSAEKQARMLSECRRVLRPGGLLVVVTYGPPSSRMQYLQAPRLRWKAKHQHVAGLRHMYSMIKKA